MNDHAEGRVQSEELSHTVYGSICNTKVKLLILLEAIKVKLLIIVDKHVVRQQSGIHVCTCRHGNMSQFDVEP